ncbi:MAG: UMP kinase, partial [Desulfurococcaceae archaeon]
PFSIITASELKSILEQRILPGEYALIDTKALDIAIRSKIEIQILNYKEPGQIFKAIRGENPGTIIIPK